MCNFEEKYPKKNRFWNNKINFIKEIDISDNSVIKYLYVLLNDTLVFAEKNKDKDLYDFSTSEIIDLVNNMFITTKINVKTQNFNIIKSYVEWAVNRGLLVTGISPCDSITQNDLRVSEKLLESNYQTLDEYYDWLKELECSDVDKATITLLRYGIKMKETLGLQFNDIDKVNKTITVKDCEKGIKLLPIDDRFCEVMDKCRTCTEYKSITYVNDDFIVKQTYRSRGGKTNENSIRNRINTVSRNNNITRINPTNLNNSRLYDFLLKIAEDKGELLVKDFKEIVLKFSYKDISESSLTNVTSTLKRQFIDIFPHIKIEKRGQGA